MVGSVMAQDRSGRLVAGSRAAATATISVLLVDDHAMVAEALGAALDAADDIGVAGVALDQASGLALAADRQPSVIVLDSHLPDMDIVAMIRAFHETLSRARSCVLGGVADYKLVMRALEAGASGFLLKGQRVNELVDAVRTVHAGGRPSAAELLSTIVDRLSAPAPRATSLTDREIDVLGRLADGATTAAVAKELRLSVNTVRNHVQSAIRRFGRPFQVGSHLHRPARRPDRRSNESMGWVTRNGLRVCGQCQGSVKTSTRNVFTPGLHRAEDFFREACGGHRQLGNRSCRRGDLRCVGPAWRRSDRWRASTGS